MGLNFSLPTRGLLHRQRTTVRNDTRIKTNSTLLHWSAMGMKLRATVARAVIPGKNIRLDNRVATAVEIFQDIIHAISH
jgi:hypothetical protein